MLTTEVAVAVDDIGARIRPALDESELAIILSGPIAGRDQPFEAEILVDLAAHRGVEITLQFSQESNLVADARLLAGVGLAETSTRHVIRTGDAQMISRVCRVSGIFLGRQHLGA